MKTKLTKILAALFIFSSVFTGCATTKTEEVDPYFLADMDPFVLGEVVCLNKQNFFKPKAITIEVEFAPRISSYRFFFKDGMNKVLLSFSKDEFDALSEAANKYISMHENGLLDPNYKPGRKNKFYKGKVDIYWGTVGLGRTVTAPFDINYENIEVKDVVNPYFRIEVQPTSYPEEENVSSPTVSLYFTPSQLKDLLALNNMEVINAEINGFNDKAYTFE